MSKGIDIFFDDPQKLASLSPRLNDSVEDEYIAAQEMGNYIKYSFPEERSIL